MSVEIKITRTQRALGIALVSLLQHNQFQNITIQDICAEALVSRSTFYVHFADKYALLRFVFEMIQKVDEPKIDQNQRVEEILTRLKEHEVMFRNLMMHEYDKEIMGIIEELYLVDLKTRIAPNRDLTEDELELISAFFLGGVTQMIMRWISSGFRTPIARLVTLQARMVDTIKPEMCI